MTAFKAILTSTTSSEATEGLGEVLSISTSNMRVLNRSMSSVNIGSSALKVCYEIKRLIFFMESQIN